MAQVFFGGWLIPLGYLVVRSGWVPRLFGYALVVGGVGYLLGLVVELVAPGADGARWRWAWSAGCPRSRSCCGCW